ncbi:MAG: universal stress protein [Marmoricola sp.]|nr:universal stress protein [Marmoricola sp.]
MTYLSHVPSGTIVVGIDGSCPSERALGWAIIQAQLEHRPLTLLHGVDLRSIDLSGAVGLDPLVVPAALKGQGQALLSAAMRGVAKRAPGLEVITAHVPVDPREALVDASTRATMVVLGSHGRSPMKTLQLGSVSLAVSRNAECPVVVLRPQEPTTEDNGILVGVGGERRNLPAVEFAYQQASFRSQPLTVMHGFWDIHGRMGLSLMSAGEAGSEDELRIVAETIAGMSEKFPDVKVSVQLRRGLVEDCLIHAGKGMGMIVIGAHPDRMALDVLTGNPTRALLEYAECMVAVVPSSTRSSA